MRRFGDFLHFVLLCLLLTIQSVKINKRQSSNHKCFDNCVAL
jgi:hypothetical protein